MTRRGVWLSALGALLGASLVVLAQPSAKGRKEAPVEDRSAKPSAEELRKRLTPLQYEVTVRAGTEPPFQNPYWDHKEPGIYVDVATGEPLFSSADKFDSGSGWPSFTKPIAPSHVVERGDGSHGMHRVEVRSKGADLHLGHVFEDGPRDRGGKRYCINSAALRFVPASRLAQEGYGELAHLFAAPAQAGDRKAPEPTREVAVLAGGCFWGMEDLLRKLPGVLDTEVGYTGGSVPNATYEVVKSGRSGHAEAVRITFDPRKLSYEQLLGWFFRMHDPTTPNQQGNDVGPQYRSAIFVADEAQRRTAEQVKRRVDESGKWRRPVVTEVVSAGPFYPAESYHQDYLVKNPGGYTCHYLRE